jgi:hypothetical protein
MDPREDVERPWGRHDRRSFKCRGLGSGSQLIDGDSPFAQVPQPGLPLAAGPISSEKK